MRDCVSLVLDELRSRELVQSWVEPAEVWEDMLHPCPACRNTSKVASNRKCRGWKLEFDGRRSLVFASSDVRGHTLQVALDGVFDARRPDSWRGSWASSPMSSCSVALRLSDAEKGVQISRQHLDLANDGQDGPVWHLQLGGIGSGADSDERRLVGALRWPSQPIDFILAIELCLYLFHNDAWADLSQHAPWVGFIRESERLVLKHYVDALENHQSQPAAPSTWLRDQCNRVGNLNPRP